MKNKKLLWILGILILVVGSVAVEGAFLDGLSNFGGNLRSTFSASGAYLPVIVNTIILTIIIYFALHLLKFKMEGKKAPLIVLAVVAVLSLSIARNMYGDQYIWFVRGFFTNVLGIMKSATKIGVFMGSSLLLWWLFNELKIGKEGFEQKLNIIMAVLIGYNLAVKDVGAPTIVKLGEVIAIWVFYRNLQAGGVKSRWVSIGGATLLVFYISSIAFEGMGLMATIPKALLTVGVIALQIGMAIGFGALGGLGINLTGLPEKYSKSGITKALSYVIGGAIVYGIFWGINQIKWFADNIGMGIFAGKSWGMLLMLVLVILGLVVGLGKANKEEDKEKRKSILGKGWRYWTTPILDSIRTSGLIFRSVLIRDKTPEGEIPFIFRRLRVEINVLINYLLRLQVYQLKQQNVNVKSKIARQANRNLKTTWSSCRQKGNSYQKRMGLKAVQNFDTSWDFKVRGFTRIKEDGIMHNDKCDTPGTMNSKNLIFRFFTILKGYLENEEFLKNPANVRNLRSEFWRVKKIAGESFAELLGDISDQDGTFMGSFDERAGRSQERYKAFLNMIKNYGKTQIRDSCRTSIFDQTRKHGLYKHSYKFARPWARAFWVKGVIRNGKIAEIPGSIIGRDKKPIGYVDGKDKWERDTGQLYEVDEKGRILQDINRIEIEEKHNEGEKVEYRKIRFNERIDHTALSHFLDALVTEWDYFIQDFRKGQFHKNVRLVTEFLDCHNNPPFDWAYRRVYNNTNPRPDPGQDAPAFDRQALKDPGNFIYKGIKSLYHTDQTDIEQPYFVNDVPAVTTMGLTLYIQNLLDRIEGNMESKKIHASTYAWDDGTRTVSSFKIKEESGEKNAKG